MMETSQENQENEYDDLYIAEFSLLDDTMMIMIQIVIILKKLKKLSKVIILLK